MLGLGPGPLFAYVALHVTVHVDEDARGVGG